MKTNNNENRNTTLVVFFEAEATAILSPLKSSQAAKKTIEMIGRAKGK